MRQYTTQGGMKMHRFSADCDAYNRVADQVMKEASVPSLDLYQFTKSLGSDFTVIMLIFTRTFGRNKQPLSLAG